MIFVLAASRYHFLVHVIYLENPGKWSLMYFRRDNGDTYIYFGKKIRITN